MTADHLGRVVAITGAAGGIGSALARAFTRHGDHVALLDLPTPSLDALVQTLREEGREALSVACDVTSEDVSRRAIETVVDRFGGLDVLVNNAGITHLGRFAETDVAVLRRVMDVNFFGAVNCTKAALASLAASRGTVVVLSSVAGFAPLAGRSGYAASKHALHGLFDSLRVELRREGIHVLLVCPSFVATDIGKHALGPDGGAPRIVRTTTGRAASPDEVAEAIVRAARARRRMLVLSPIGVASWWLTRLWPAAYDRMMERRLLREEAPASDPADPPAPCSRSCAASPTQGDRTSARSGGCGCSVTTPFERSPRARARAHGGRGRRRGPPRGAAARAHAS